MSAVWQAVEGWTAVHLIRRGVTTLPAHDRDPLAITVCGRVVRDPLSPAGVGAVRCGQCEGRAKTSEEADHG